MVFILLFQPLLEGLASLILSGLEAIKSYFALIISHNNQQINEPEVKYQIGFSKGDYEE